MSGSRGADLASGAVAAAGAGAQGRVSHLAEHVDDLARGGAVCRLRLHARCYEICHRLAAFRRHPAGSRGSNLFQGLAAQAPFPFK